MPSLGLEQSQSQQQTQTLALNQKQLQGLQTLQATLQECRQDIVQQLAQNPMLLQVQDGILSCEDDLRPPEPNAAEQEERFRAERDQDADVQEFRERLYEKQSEYLPDVGAEEPPDSDRGGEASGNDLLEARLRERTHDLPASVWGDDEEERRQHFFDSYSVSPGFLETIRRQCDDELDGTPRFRMICRELCAALDEYGLFRWVDKETKATHPWTDEELAKVIGVSPTEIAEAIRSMQQRLDPPGIAAHSWQECLLLQLERKRLKGSLEWEILAEHLEDLRENRIPKIAQEMGVGVDEIQDAVRRIRELDCRPADQIYCNLAPTVIPDILVEFDKQGALTMRSNKDTLPVLALDRDYVRMMADPTTDKTTREYLVKQTAAATDLIASLDERWRTIEKIAAVLLKRQAPFFASGNLNDMRPLRQSDLTEDVGYVESTISRGISGKYIQTPWGVFPFKAFFTTSSYKSESGEDISAQKVRNRIRELVAAEDPRKPLSDQVLSDTLAKEGLKVARRTIAKYRDLEGIPDTSKRRQHV